MKKLKEKLERPAAIFLAVVFAIAFVLMGVDHQADLEKARILVRDGVQTTARVTAQHVSGRRSRTYYVYYSYQAAGKTWEREGKVDRDSYDELAPGMVIPVRFMADDPRSGIIEGELLRLESWGNRFGPYIATVVAALFLMANLPGAWGSPRKPRDSRRKSKSPSSGSRRAGRGPRG